MVWYEADCCEYVMLRLAQNTRIDEIRIEGWPALLYARKHNYGRLKKLVAENNAELKVEEREGEGEEGEDYDKTYDEGEIGEEVDASGEEGDLYHKSDWSEIKQLQDHVTEIETGLHMRLRELKANLAIAKLEKNQVVLNLGGQVGGLQKKLNKMEQANERLKWEIAELKTAVGVVKCQKKKMEKNLMLENNRLKKQVQEALLEVDRASARKPEVVPQDEEKYVDQEDVNCSTKEASTESQECHYDWLQKQIKNDDHSRSKCNAHENGELEDFVNVDKMFEKVPSKCELAKRFSSQIEELEKLFDVKIDLAVANAKLKGQLALQELEQKRQLEEVTTENKRLEKLIDDIRCKYKQSRVKNQKSVSIFAVACAIVEKYLEVSSECEVHSSYGTSPTTDESESCTTHTYEDCLQQPYNDMKAALLKMLKSLDCEIGADSLQEFTRDISSIKKDLLFFFSGRSSQEFLWTRSLSQTPEEFNTEMPLDFKPSEREIEAVKSSFLVHPAG